MTILGKINKKGHKRRILVAPLDWGLGHATRCIPIIRLLVKEGVDVVIAAKGRISVLFQQEFPELPIIELQGYEVRYSRSKYLFFKMALQAPRILGIIKKEQKWLSQVIDELEIDAVISDNRFGLHSNKVPCAFITHQLSVQTGLQWLNRLAQKINYRYINNFSVCWVPDMAGKDNLAGILSHPVKMPSIPVKYIGVLSRLQQQEKEKKIELLVLLSGPEPQRSMFEKMIIKQIAQTENQTVIVRGLPETQTVIEHHNRNLVFVNYADSHLMNDYILQSKNIIARSGYSTLMDLVMMQQPALLVPTPGQTEQLYLANYLEGKYGFTTIEQDKIESGNIMKKLPVGVVVKRNPEMQFNQQEIVDWVNSIRIR